MKITKLREKEGEPALSTISLEQLLERIKCETKQQPVSAFREELREILPYESYDYSKKLTRIIPAAEFGRTSDGQQMKNYNGIVELTVGPLTGKEEIDLVKQRAWEVPQTRCLFMGSSAHTVKIWTTFARPDETLPTTIEEAEMFHAHAYRLAVKYYQPQVPFEIQLKEPRLDQYSRLSYDPEVKYRPDSKPFYLAQPTAMPDEPTYRETVQQKKSVFQRASALLNESDNIIVMFENALHQTFFDLAKQKEQDRLESETEKMSDEQIRLQEQAELQEQARSYEQRERDETERLVMQLAVNCFQKGIPEEEAVIRAISYCYHKMHKLAVREIFANAYRPKRGFGKQKEINNDQWLSLQTDEFMKRRYEFRYNAQVGEVEYRERSSFCFRFRPVDKRILNSIALDAQAENIPLWDKDVSRYVYSNRVPMFRPLEEFMCTLPEWDGKERIEALAQRVPCNNPHWPKLFHRWLLNMVAHWQGLNKNFANSVSPLLVGGQGTHKSTFCRNLLPPSIREYYTDSIDFSRKQDAERYLNRFALINIDEFDQVSATQQGFLKHILQKPVLNVRKLYGSAVLEMPRYASFIATSNQKDLLTDPTGSRRFICIEVIDVIDTSRSINHNQLYAQALEELMNGERYWFDQEEERLIAESNREFEQVTPEEQLFYHFFQPAKENESGEWLSPAEILGEMKKGSAIPLSPKRVSVFGRLLQKHKVPSKRTRRGTVYCVTRL